MWRLGFSLRREVTGANVFTHFIPSLGVYISGSLTTAVSVFVTAGSVSTWKRVWGGSTGAKDFLSWSETCFCCGSSCAQLKCSDLILLGHSTYFLTFKTLNPREWGIPQSHLTHVVVSAGEVRMLLERLGRLLRTLLKLPTTATLRNTNGSHQCCLEVAHRCHHGCWDCCRHLIEIVVHWIEPLRQVLPQTFHHLVVGLARLRNSVIQFVESVGYCAHRGLKVNGYLHHLAGEGLKAGSDHLIAVCVVRHIAHFINPDWLLRRSSASRAFFWINSSSCARCKTSQKLRFASPSYNFCCNLASKSPSKKWSRRSLSFSAIVFSDSAKSPMYLTRPKYSRKVFFSHCFTALNSLRLSLGLLYCCIFGFNVSSKLEKWETALRDFSRYTCVEPFQILPQPKRSNRLAMRRLLASRSTRLL